jgi:hypothetical protein
MLHRVWEKFAVVSEVLAGSIMRAMIVHKTVIESTQKLYHFAFPLHS